MNHALPHTGVMVRLAPSKIHGIGVFACMDIPQGTDVFPNDHREIAWVTEEEVRLADITDFQRAFYLDFGIRSGGKLGCPSSFDLLTVGWYVNEPAVGDKANLRATADYRLLAARSIAAGEELTVHYGSFSDLSGGLI